MHRPEARDAVTALQHALLPADLPALPAVRVAARYALAADEQAAGGDWYDVVPAGDGRVGLVVGDVVGHGVAASAVMVQLRTLAVDRLEVGAGPGEVVAALERHARRRAGTVGATVCVVVLDTRSGHLTYCTAGHPPPLVVPTGAGEARFLVPSGGGPLATGTTGAVLDEELRRDEILLLYTDGIIERPHRAPGRSSVELREVATASARNRASPLGASAVGVDRVCEQVLDLLTLVTGHRDDITLLAAQRAEPLPPLHCRFTLDGHDGGATAMAARDGARRWLAEVAPSMASARAADVAVSELVQNVVDHAYGAGGTGPVELDARLDEDGTLWLTLTDHGSWRPPVPGVSSGRGLGLALVEEHVDALDVDGGPAGTRATVRLALRRPAGLLSSVGPAAATGEQTSPYTCLYTGGAAPRLTVRGPVDEASAGDLAYEVRLRTAPGSALTLDLSAVSLLTSAGVRLLFRQLDEARRRDTELHLHAPAGSTAHRVLAVAHVPCSSEPLPPLDGD